MSVIKHDIVLNDKVSGPAKSASAAVSETAKQFTVLTKALSSAQDRMTKASATGNIKAFQGAKADVTSLKAALSLLPPPAAKAEAATAALGSAAQSTGSSSAGLQAELAELTGGLSIVAEAAGAVVLGFGALVIAGAAFAIKSSEAKNAAISLYNALGQGKITGEAVDDMLDGLRASTGLTKDSLGPMTEAFLRMGITGEDALKGLTVAAASAEALGKGGAAAFTKLYQQADTAAETGSKLSIPYKKLEAQLIATGLNVDDLASQMGMSGAKLTAGLKAGTVDARKFGDALQDAVTKKGVGPMATLANSSANLGKLLQEYLGDLFEDLGKDIAPFMGEVKSLFSILDSKANPSGQALKSGIGAFFKQVFASATVVVPMVKHFLLDVIIYGLKAYIALKPIVAAIIGIGQNATAMKIVTTIFTSLAIVAGVVAVAFGVVAAAVLVVVAILVGLQVAIVAAVGYMLGFVADVSQALAGWVASGATVAGDFVQGLVDGIKSGTGIVIDAVTALGGSALKGIKDTLGIASPSKKMHALGVHGGEGLAGGFDASAGDVGNAAGDMGNVAVASTADAVAGNARSSGGGSPSGASVTVNCEITVNGAGKSAEEITDEMVSLAWERAAMAAGL